MDLIKEIEEAVTNATNAFEKEMTRHHYGEAKKVSKAIEHLSKALRALESSPRSD